MNITTDNTAELQARVRELEKQLEAADRMRKKIFVSGQGAQRDIEEFWEAIAAYDAVRSTPSASTAT